MTLHQAAERRAELLARRELCAIDLRHGRGSAGLIRECIRCIEADLADIDDEMNCALDAEPVREAMQ